MQLGEMLGLVGRRRYPLTMPEKAIFRQLSYGDRLRAYIRRHRPLHDVYMAETAYEPRPGESIVVPNREIAIPRRLRGEGAQAFLEPLDITIADGTQVSNTVTETIFCPDFSIPAFYMAPYKTLYIWAFGVCSNVVTTPGTLILAVRWGGVGGVVLFQSAAQGMDTTAHTNALWMMEGYIICRTAGATGTFMSGGIMGQFNLLSSTAANLLPALMGSAGAPGASGNVAVTVDTTTAKLLSCTAKFSVATSPTNLTCQQRIIVANN